MPIEPSLLRAVAAAPADDTPRLVYADWLDEHGDPARAAFIRAQIWSADPSRPASERAALHRQWDDLLRRHAADWLGDLADPLLNRDDVGFRFDRGWLAELDVGTMREDLAALIAPSPEVALLERLVIAPPGHGGEAFDRRASARTTVLAGVVMYTDEEEPALVPLLESEYLGNVRYLQLGDEAVGPTDVGDDPVPGLVEKMPRLEELRLFLYGLDAERLFGTPWEHLRVLRVGGVFDYPLSVLADNPAAAGLTDLAIEPAHPDGHQPLDPEEAVRLVCSEHLANLKHLRLRFCAPSGGVLAEAVARSGVLGRLESLDLQFCGLDESDAAALASAPGFAALGRLDVSYNPIPEPALDRLRSAGVEVVYDGPPPEEDSEPVEGDSDEFMLGQG